MTEPEPPSPPDNPFQSPRPVPPGDGPRWRWKVRARWIVLATSGGLALATVVAVMWWLVSSRTERAAMWRRIIARPFEEMPWGIDRADPVLLVGVAVLVPAALMAVTVLVVGLIRRGSPDWLRAAVYGWRTLALTALLVVLVPVAVTVAVIAYCVANGPLIRSSPPGAVLPVDPSVLLR